ncbi:MAG: toprim domain-containing protein [Desulfosarcina sp.]|nr:toprim domain-containing protein [Desulfosarcina sp.]
MEHPFTTEKPDKDAEKSDHRYGQLRKAVATYYHQKLLEKKDALSYLIDERGHSMDCLNRFLVGFASGDLIGHIKSLGQDINDLISIGLAKTTGNSTRPVIASGMYVFPHYVEGEIGHFSIKDPSGKYRYQIKKSCAVPGWLCFGQDNLTSTSTIVIVEGENDLLSVAGKAGWESVVCTLGNFNTSNILKWLRKNANQKTFYLCFDNDDAGRQYTKKYTNAILAGRGTPKIVIIPEGFKDVDEVLRADPNPVEKFKQMMLESLPVIPDAAKLSNHDNHKKQEDVFKFDAFKIHGEDEAERIVLESTTNKKIYSVSLRDLTFDKMLQIGGDEVDRRVYLREKSPEDGKIPFRILKAYIIKEAAKNQMGQLALLGQGVHLIDNDALLIVNGCDAFIWNGERISQYEETIINKKVIERIKAKRWVRFQSVKKKLEGMNYDFAFDIVEELLVLINRWGFVGQSTAFLIAGWFLAQWIQKIWDWRPHLWLSGGSETGKTTLIELLERLGGALSMRREGQTLTEAAFRQDIGYSASLYMIDEFEKTDSRDKIIEVIRSANRGGIIPKGTTTQKAIHYSLRHMVLFASIEMGLARSAEESRFICIETKKDQSRMPIIPSLEESGALRERILAYVLWASYRSRELVKSVEPIHGISNRLHESFAVPLSMIAAREEDSRTCLATLMEDTLEDYKIQQQDAIPDDEDNVFDTILSSTVHLTMEKVDESGDVKFFVSDRSVSQLIPEAASSTNIADSLCANGITSCGDGLFIVPDVVARKLLWNSQFKGLRIGTILARIDGAKKTQRRIGGRRPRGILIPVDYCYSRGVQCDAFGLPSPATQDFQD